MSGRVFNFRGGFSMRVFYLAATFLAMVSAALAAPMGPAGKWRIAAVSGAEGLDPARARAEMTEARFASTIGCNRIAGKPAFSGAKLTFGPMMTTRMACPPPLDEVERAYLAALQATRGFRFEGTNLVFLGEDGAPLVTLEREK
jgi:heat shock protein HslJ